MQGWLVNPLLPININKMHRTKHGSDSEVYDTEGRFVPEKFEASLVITMAIRLAWHL